jgi:hypothetical protein
MVDDVLFDGLPANWNALDLAAFSRTKTLWDYTVSSETKEKKK